MERMNLKASVREETGKESVKKLRKEGVVPAVVYKGKKALNIKIAAREFLKAIHTKAGANVVVTLTLESDGKEPVKRPIRTAIIKEIQHHPVKDEILHVDFHEISLTEVLTMKIPIAVKGDAAGLKEGGVLEHILWEVEVECLPTQIPESIPVNVSALNIGDSIHVKDLHLPEGVKVLSEPESVVISVAMPHVEKEEGEPIEGAPAEPEVIMEKKPEEESDSEEASKGKKPE